MKKKYLNSEQLLILDLYLLPPGVAHFFPFLVGVKDLVPDIDILYCEDPYPRDVGNRHRFRRGVSFCRIVD